MPKDFDTCIFCWKRKATEVFVKGQTRICKGCNYEIGRVLSFFEYMGYRMTPVSEQPLLSPLKPPKSTSSTKLKPVKAVKEAQDKAASQEDGAQQGQGT